MTETTMIRLDALQLRRTGLRCPVCGRVHGLGRRLLWLGLLLAVVLALPAGGPVRANTGVRRTAAARFLGPPPAPSPVPPTAAAPAALAVPDTAVVWNPEGTGVYRWDRPGGAIVGFIENGLVVRVTERWEAAGGVPFGEMEFQGTIGWVDMRSVHRVFLPAGGFDRLAQGSYLYDAPGGRILRRLSPGTPVVVVAAGEAGWVEVELVVGGDIGWVTEEAAIGP